MIRNRTICGTKGCEIESRVATCFGHASQET